MSKNMKINNSRNSECGSARLAGLDWSSWFTDRSFGRHYIHVAGDDDSWHRVYCRHSLKPRIHVKDGEPYWIVDDEEQE